MNSVKAWATATERLVSPGAAHGDDQGGLPLLHVLGQQEGEELFQMPA